MAAYDPQQIFVEKLLQPLTWNNSLLHSSPQPGSIQNENKNKDTSYTDHDHKVLPIVENYKGKCYMQNGSWQFLVCLHSATPTKQPEAENHHSDTQFLIQQINKPEFSPFHVQGLQCVCKSLFLNTATGICKCF